MIPNPPILFHSDYIESLRLDDPNWLRLSPFGVQVSPMGQRPILLLKDQTGVMTLPVSLNPVEAGVALTQSNKSIAPMTPHRVSQVLLESLNLQFSGCYFIEIKGASQYVQLNLKGHSDLKFIKIRADEAMSFCLHLDIPIFATALFIERSKVLSAEQEVQTHSMLKNSEMHQKHHKYVM